MCACARAPATPPLTQPPYITPHVEQGKADISDITLSRWLPLKEEETYIRKSSKKKKKKENQATGKLSIHIYFYHVVPEDLINSSANSISYFPKSV